MLYVEIGSTWMKLSVDNFEDFNCIENVISTTMPHDDASSLDGWVLHKSEFENIVNLIDCLVEIHYIPSCNYGVGGWKRQVENRGGRIFYRGAYRNEIKSFSREA